MAQDFSQFVAASPVCNSHVGALFACVVRGIRSVSGSRPDGDNGCGISKHEALQFLQYWEPTRRSVSARGGIIVEEVVTFKPYLQRFCKQLEDRHYSVKAFVMDADVWISWPRQRTRLSLKSCNRFEQKAVGFLCSTLCV